MASDDLARRARAARKRRGEYRPVGDHAGHLHPSDRSLQQALSGETFGYILECKRVVPFGDDLGAGIDPTALASTLGPLAHALSYTTHRAHTPGNRQQLTELRAATDCPILLNDVIVDPSQIRDARDAGADAVVVMVGLLDDVQFRDCLSTADSLQVDVVAAADNEADLRRILNSDVQMVGIDRREIHGAAIDAPAATRLTEMIPDHHTRIAIGGASTHRDIVALGDHVDAVLTGGSLLESNDLPRALRQLVYGHVKVSGLVDGDDARSAWQAGATYGGLIFAPGSARHIPYARARCLTDRAPLEYVGVFVNDPIDDIACCAQHLDLAAVQLHGAETNDDLLDLRRRLPAGTEIWKAGPIRAQLPRMSAIHADRILLDNFDRADADCSGAFDWSALGTLSSGARRRMILGGDLSPHNVVRADRLGTWALDVTLGGKASTGITNPTVMAQLFAALRGRRPRRPTRQV